MYLEFSDNLTALRRTHPCLAWLLALLLCFAGTASASHFHLDGETCIHGHHHGEHCHHDHDDHHELDESEHQCSLCPLIKLGQGIIDTTTLSVAAAAPFYQTLWHLSEQGSVPPEYHRARAPPTTP